MALNRSDSPKSGILTPRRVTLLASIAALGAAVLLAGPGGYQPSALTSPARATETMACHPGRRRQAGRQRGRRAQRAQRGQDPRQARRSHAREDGRCDQVRGRAARHCVRTAVPPHRWCRCLQGRWGKPGTGACPSPLLGSAEALGAQHGPRQPTHRRDNARCKARSFRYAD